MACIDGASGQEVAFTNQRRIAANAGFRLVPFCEVNLKSPGENLFTSPALLPAILRYGFQTLNSKLPIWALNIGLACTARK
ncbi:hypothetical protein DZC04_18760 [Salmonella enterica]|nr:hypothetical protein [Salmonella enterica]